MTQDEAQFGDNEQDREILALLKDYPAPEGSGEFFDRTVLRATHEGSRRQRNRWLMTGFGGAIAAGLALWMIGGLYFNSPELPPDPGLPSVTMTLEEPRTINLMFASTEPLEDATLTVVLPPGIELAGFPGQREISWQTNLSAGRNLLPLELIALSSSGGEVLATLEHDARGRTFRLQIDVHSMDLTMFSPDSGHELSNEMTGAG